MTVEPVVLDAGEGFELGELLGFLVAWLDRDGDRLASSLRSFVGCDGYDIDGLRADLSRFGFLVGGDSETTRFGGGGR